MNSGARWSIEDDKYLKDNYNSQEIGELAIYFQRSYNAVKVRYEQISSPQHWAYHRLRNEKSITVRLACDCTPGVLYKDKKAYEQHKRNSTHIIFILKTEIKELRIKLEKEERKSISYLKQLESVRQEILKREEYFDAASTIQ